MAFWGGFMAQNGQSNPDLSASLGWRIGQLPHDWAVFWPMRIFTDYQAFDDDAETHLESRE